MDINEPDRQADPPPGQELPETTEPSNSGMVDRLKDGTQLAVNEEWLRRKIDDEIPASLVANLKRQVRLELDGARVVRQTSTAAPLSARRRRERRPDCYGLRRPKSCASCLRSRKTIPHLLELVPSLKSPWELSAINL